MRRSGSEVKAPHVGVIRPEDTNKFFGTLSRWEILLSVLHVMLSIWLLVAVFIYPGELLVHSLNMFQCQF